MCCSVKSKTPLNLKSENEMKNRIIQKLFPSPVLVFNIMLYFVFLDFTVVGQFCIISLITDIFTVVFQE